MCYNCKIILEFVQGAQHVQCGKCKAVNKVPEPVTFKL